MNKQTSLWLIGLALLGASGCASVYTNIERTGENQYLVTRVEQGFFSVSGTLYRCTAKTPIEMTCQEVGAP